MRFLFVLFAENLSLRRSMLIHDVFPAQARLLTRRLSSRLTPKTSFGSFPPPVLLLTPLRPRLFSPSSPDFLSLPPTLPSSLLPTSSSSPLSPPPSPSSAHHLVFPSPSSRLFSSVFSLLFVPTLPNQCSPFPFLFSSSPPSVAPCLFRRRSRCPFPVFVFPTRLRLVVVPPATSVHLSFVGAYERE